MRRPVTIAGALLLLLSLTAGCGGKKAPAAQAAKVLKYNAGSDFRSLDPQMISDTTSSAAAYQLYDGLIRMGPNGNQPAAAERWDLTEDGKRYTFHLRDSRWSNGDPVTADDFVYAWTRGLDPATGSEYAYQLYYIKGGRALNEAKDAAAVATAKQNLGLRAIDPKTLEVTLETPAPYWLDLVGSPTYFPVNRKAVEANRTTWATKPETLVSNGPFKLQSWAPKNQATMVKNPNYWNAANVKLDQVTFTFVEEQSTALQLWENGQLDMMQSPPSAELARLRRENKLQFAPTFGTYYYFFNVAQKPFDDPKVRRALSLAVDRESIVTNVTKAGQRPATGFVPYGAKDETGKDFRESSGALLSYNLTEAKRLLAEAGYPDGQGFPAVELLYNTSEGHKAIAEAVIEMWRKNLSITSIRATNLEWKVLLDRSAKGDFAMARTSWVADYLDPMSFLEIFTSGNGQNGGRYTNPQYDKLVATARGTLDQNVRMPAMRQAEHILISDMPLIPIYFYTMPFLQSARVSGVFQNGVGVIDFSGADVH